MVQRVGGSCFFFFFSSRRRHTRSLRDWSSDVCSSDLELELVDVRLVEDERRSEDHLGLPVRALDDLVAAELAGLERLADLARDVTGRDRRDRVAREVPEILRVPERELLDRAVMDVLLHLARQAEPGEDNLVLELRVREELRGR